eukprot:7008311-Pyramimonas_sp.AAC.2
MMTVTYHLSIIPEVPRQSRICFISPTSAVLCGPDPKRSFEDFANTTVRGVALDGGRTQEPGRVA